MWVGRRAGSEQCNILQEYIFLCFYFTVLSVIFLTETVVISYLLNLVTEFSRKLCRLRLESSFIPTESIKICVVLTVLA